MHSGLEFVATTVDCLQNSHIWTVTSTGKYAGSPDES